MQITGFRTQKERNAAYEAITRCLPLCDTVDDLITLWREYADLIQQIKEHDQNTNQCADIYPLLLEAFKDRKHYILKRECYGYFEGITPKF